MTDDDERNALHEGAYAAMDRGSLAEASRAFDALLLREPANRYYHYMRGLASKYMLDWPASLRHNLRAIELSEEFGEAEHWNAAIAATALGDWQRARALWSSCGIQVPEGGGVIEGDYGVAVVRLHPWHGGETVFMRRIDPVRARLLNVPLPESGHRFGDIVLHDGAPTGHRHDGEREVPVFNQLGRLAPSDFQTFVVFLRCDRQETLRPLLEATAPGIGYVEDWTQTVRHYCMRCSYGTPHRHQAHAGESWQPQRNLGFAAQSRHSVEKLLGDWTKSGPGRDVENIETREADVPPREDGQVWWDGPEDEEASSSASTTST